MFRLWGEASVSEENMQTAHRKGPVRQWIQTQYLLAIRQQR